MVVVFFDCFDYVVVIEFVWWEYDDWYWIEID